MIELPKLFSLTSSSPSSSFFVAASSSLNLLYFHNITFTKLLLLCKVHQIPLPTSGHSPTMNSGQWSYTHFTLASRADFITCSVDRIFLAVVLKDFITTPCTDLQTWQFLIRWKEYLMELLNIQFSSIVHL